MSKVAVLGCGMTNFGKHTMNNIELFTLAAEEAIKESNIEKKEIQALFLGNALGEFEEGQINMAAFCVTALGLKNIAATRYEAACASSTVALREAYISILSGMYDIVLVGGTERAIIMGTPFATRTFAMASDALYEQPAGVTFPGIFAMLTHLYSYTYNIPLDRLKKMMIKIAVKNHSNAMFNEKAHFHRQITEEILYDLEKNPYIADPLQLYDCCPFSDGAACLVLAKEEIAKKVVDKPVYIVGAGQASAGPLYTQPHLPRLIAREIAAKQAYEQARMTPKDIDVVELHDCFTIAEIIASEGLGLFEHGRGGYAVEEGRTLLTGDIPINPSGGLKAKGHPIGATGCAQAIEIVEQLRGKCGERQINNAEVGLIDTLGGDGGTICDIIFCV